MTTQSIKVGDVVECDVRGDRFFGTVAERDRRELTVRPIGVRERYPRIVTARQVVGHYRRSKSSR